MTILRKWRRRRKQQFQEYSEENASVSKTGENKENLVGAQSNMVEKENIGCCNFVKGQHVQYDCKISKKWCDATVIGVHFDDGPDEPYYTIQLRRPKYRPESTGFETIEKQTTGSRLRNFDEGEKQNFVGTQSKMKQSVAADFPKFVKREKVKYYCSIANQWCDATVKDVHYDGSSDEPYFTIQYGRFEVELDSVEFKPIETQTIGNNLTKSKT
mmetsp:Transcript_22662/g.33460  ORF Transcript_22662/g.33460 Transcript_22662/m.33460 type:complete len:214 (-) Transcript_22662:65-706(-)